MPMYELAPEGLTREHLPSAVQRSDYVVRVEEQQCGHVVWLSVTKNGKVKHWYAEQHPRMNKQTMRFIRGCTCVVLMRLGHVTGAAYTHINTPWPLRVHVSQGDEGKQWFLQLVDRLRVKYEHLVPPLGPRARLERQMRMLLVQYACDTRARWECGSELVTRSDPARVSVRLQEGSYAPPLFGYAWMAWIRQFGLHPDFLDFPVTRPNRDTRLFDQHYVQFIRLMHGKYTTSMEGVRMNKTLKEIRKEYDHGRQRLESNR